MTVLQTFDIGRINSAHSIADLRKLNADNLISLKARFLSGDSVYQLVTDRAHFVDQLLIHLWFKHDLDTIPDLALVAVGGYGRGELHPYSDVDILILSTRTVAAKAGDKISTFIATLWDIRLEIGQSVRTVGECIKLGKGDQTIGTNLTESRLLCGAPQPFRKLQQEVSSKRFWPSDKLYQAKLAEQEERHEQYHDTGYGLEPNIKSNPGGLRDIQTVGWVAKNHFNANSLEELIEHGFLTPEEYHELIECQGFLWQVRFLLHIEAGRSENRLLFEFQPKIATTLGFVAQGNKGVETFMKRLYQTIRRIRELNAMLMQLFGEAILGESRRWRAIKLDDRFTKRKHIIELNDLAAFKQRPQTILELFLHIADDPEITDISATTVRALREARRTLSGHLCDHPACRTLFMELIKHPRGAGRPFDRMHRHHVLAAYFPQWEHIVGQSQFDLFHAYTVDEHTNRLVQNLYHFLRPKNDEHKGFHLCIELMQKMRKPELLFLAGIFHDIAKGRGGDHSQLGAVDALAFCQLHDIAENDAALVAWVVENHLLMSVTAQKRDIHDADVVNDFAEKIHDETHLDMLLCLTVADIRATNDNQWNSWKSALLQELYFATQKVLRRGLEKPVDMGAQIEQTKAEARDLLQLHGYAVAAVDQLWQRFYDDYFCRYTCDQIAWHTAGLLEHSDRSEPLVMVSKHITRGGTEIFVYAPERANVFAHAVALLDRKGLNIYDAQIMSTRDHYVLDSFVVLDREGEPLTAPLRVNELISELPKVIVDPGYKPASASRQLPRQMRHFNIDTSVTFLNVEDASRTMVELVALDRPGLLALVGAVFETLNLALQAAKITTIGERAEDFFILVNSNGGALTEQERQQLKLELCKALDLSFDDQ